jgi:hypothetical protein
MKTTQNFNSTNSRLQDSIIKKKVMEVKNINYQQILQNEVVDTGGIQILLNSYATIEMLAKKYTLKLNIVPTIIVSFEPLPTYLRTDPKNGNIVSSLMKTEQ